MLPSPFDCSPDLEPCAAPLPPPPTPPVLEVFDLPHTGGDWLGLAVLALLCVLVGTAFVAITRRWL